MRYVFKVLKKLDSIEQVNINKTDYYRLPIVSKTEQGYTKILQVLFDKKKTFIRNGSLYLVLDTENKFKDNINYKDVYLCYKDSSIIDMLSNDYLEYIVHRSNYIPTSSHAISYFTPLGTSQYNEESDSYVMDKWSDVIAKVKMTYPKDLVAIDPYNCSKIYPFHYNKFTDQSYIREYLSHVVMFVLSTNKDIVYTDKKIYDDNSYIYYRTPDKYYPLFKMLNETQYYESCLNKDTINRNKTPFLKSFGEHGIDKNTLHRYKEDEDFSSDLKAEFKKLREKIDLNKDNKLYFIPSLDKEFLNIKFRIKNNQKTTKKQRDALNKAINKRVEDFAKLYDKHHMFYFTSEDIKENLENINNYCLLKQLTTYPEEIIYDKEHNLIKARYYDNDNNSYTIPLFEIVNKANIDAIKELVYSKWINSKLSKNNKSR